MGQIRKDRVFVVLFFLAVFCCYSNAAILSVPSQYSTIQAAIDMAQEGDQILVADGVYVGEGNRNIDFQGKTVTLKSDNGPTNCIIDCESVENCTAFVLIENCDPVIEGFTIVRCSTLSSPPAITLRYSNAIIKNCIFTDNAACIYSFGANAKVLNCTFYGNTAASDGGAVGMSTNIHIPATFWVRNSILWKNEPKDIDFDFHMCKSGAHPGMFVEFSILESNWQNQQYLTFENCIYGQDPLLADPNNGDFHLKSQQGRWEAFSQQWVKDSVTSPAIDAGAPDDDYSRELWPHGGRINLGAYGNTPEASLSVVSCGVAADSNGDDLVNLTDISCFSVSWQTTRVPSRHDFNRDNSVDLLDLAEIASNWLLQIVDPTLSLSQQQFVVGESIVVSFSDMPGNQFDWVGICQKGDSIESWAGAMIEWSYTDGTQTGTAGILSGEITFTGLSEPGDYEVRLFFDGNYQIKARSFITVVPDDGV